MSADLGVKPGLVVGLIAGGEYAIQQRWKAQKIAGKVVLMI